MRIRIRNTGGRWRKEGGGGLALRGGPAQPPGESIHTQTYLKVSDFWIISLALETMMSTRVETGTQDRNRCMLIV